MTKPLTVESLRDLRLQENPPFLAVLSACSTIAADAEGLEDEGIHLVSAFHLAGFTNVVGTLWPVFDPHCAEVATILYDTIKKHGMTDETVCLGLHNAVRAPRYSTEGASEANAATDELASETGVGSQSHDKSPEADDHAEDGGEADENRNRAPREMVPVGSSDNTSAGPMYLHPKYWAPYIHFG